MLRRAIVMVLAAVVPLVAWTPPSYAEPVLSLHFGPLTYPGCAAINTDTLDCADIVVEGDPTSAQRVYVLAAGIDVINAVEFGITYPASVTPRHWLACGDGVTAIAESGWPATGKGIALAWSNGLASDGPDSLAVLGYLEIESGSTGVISLIADPRTGYVSYVDPAEATIIIPAGRLGQADAGGQGAGLLVCNEGGAESQAQLGAPSLGLHVLPRSATGAASPCAIRPLDCQELIVEGDPRSEQRVFVVVSGVSGLCEVTFGIAYMPDVRVIGWESCAGAQIHTTADWPANGSGITMTWGQPHMTPDGGAVVGYFDVESASSGVLSLTRNPRAGAAEVVDVDHTVHAFDWTLLARADVGGGGGGFSACDTEPPSAESGQALLVREEASLISNHYDCRSDVPNGLDRDDTRVWKGTVIGPTAEHDPGTFDVATHALKLDVFGSAVGYGSRIPMGTTGSQVRNEAASFASNGSEEWTGGPYPNATPDFSPRIKLIAQDPDQPAYLHVAGEIVTIGGDVDGWLGLLDAETGVLADFKTIHITSIDGDDRVAGIVAYDGYVYVGGVATNGDDARAFMVRYALDLADNPITGLGDYTVPSAQGYDVALDPLASTFYVAGTALTVSTASSGTVLGFDLTTGNLVYEDPFDAMTGLSPRAERIGLDLYGNVHIGGVVVDEGIPKLFTARDKRFGGIGAGYISYYTGGDTFSLADIIFGDLTVSLNGLTYLVAEAGIAPSAVYTENLIVWYVDAEGVVRWDTFVECEIIFEHSLVEVGGIEYREQDAAVVVAAALAWPDVPLERPCSGYPAPGEQFDGPCTHVLRLAHDNGEIQYVAYTDYPPLGEALDGEQFPRLMSTTSGTRVYVGTRTTSTEYAEPAPLLLRELLVEAFEVPFGAPVDVQGGGHPGTEGDQLRAVASMARSDLKIRVAGLGPERGASVRVFDVGGRLLREAQLQPGRDSVRFSGLAPGVYFVRATSGAATGTTRAVVIK